MAETKAQQPTAEGLLRYADYTPPGYYEELPCTCNPECPPACTGACGCAACRAAFYDAAEYD